MFVFHLSPRFSFLCFWVNFQKTKPDFELKEDESDKSEEKSEKPLSEKTEVSLEKKEEEKPKSLEKIQVTTVFTQTDEDLKSSTPPPEEREVAPPVEVEVRETQVKLGNTIMNISSFDTCGAKIS